MMLMVNGASFAASAGMLGMGAAAGFFLVAAVVAYIAFKILKRSVKMAFRLVIVAIILVIAVAGSIALWAIESKPSAPVPHSSR